MILTREQILEHRLPVEAIDVGNDMQILVRALPLHVIQKTGEIKSAEFSSDVFIFANAVVDAAGKRLYTDADMPMIAETVASPLVQLVVSTAYRLSRVDEVMLERIKKNWKSLGVETLGG